MTAWKHFKNGWRTVRGVMAPFISDYILAIEVPQELVIKNARLGLLYKILQAMAMIALLIYVSAVQIWNVSIVPQPYSLAAWPREVQPEALSRAQQQTYCTDPESYSYNWVGFFHYRPTSCQRALWADGWLKDGNQIFVATFMLDYNGADYANVTAKNPNTCAQMRAECAAGGGVYTPEGERCSCFRFRELFVQGVEETRIQILHGFQAVSPSGAVDKSFAQWGSGNSQQAKIITTYLRDTDGNPCLVNGVSMLKPEDISDDGISGTLGEWMACAGAHLDDGPAEFGGGDGMTKLRLMGFSLAFQLHYVSTGDNSVDCLITPRVSPQWTNIYQSSTSFNDIAMSDSRFESARVAHGAAIFFEVTGALRYFSISKLISGIVNVFFLMSVPKMIMHFICCYMLGTMSHVYRNAKRTRFSIRDQLQIAIARCLMPNMVFRGLTGGEFHRPAELLPEISAEEMKRCVQDVFHVEMGEGQLQDRHINRMVMRLCEMNDGKFKEMIRMRDFENLCNTNEVISNSVLMDMLHWKRRRWLLEKLLDTTDRSVDAKVFPCITEDRRGIPGAAQKTSQVPVVSWGQDRIFSLADRVAGLRKRVQRMEEGAHTAHSQVEEMLHKANAAHERAELAELLVHQYAEKAVVERTKENRRRAKEKGEKDEEQVQAEEAEAAEKSEMQVMEEQVAAAEQLSKKAVEDSHAVVYRMEVIFDSMNRMSPTSATSGGSSPTSRRE